MLTLRLPSSLLAPDRTRVEMTVEGEGIRRQTARAFQLVIHLRRIEIAGKTQRLVTGVAEVTGRMEGDLPEVVPIFEDRGSGLNWSGVYPKCIEAMNERAGHAFNFREIVAG